VEQFGAKRKKEFAAVLVGRQHVELCNTSYQCFLLAPEFFTLGILEPLLKGRGIALFPFQQGFQESDCYFHNLLLLNKWCEV